MRLINTHTYALETFDSSHQIPTYAILSHTWLPPVNGEPVEVSFSDMQHENLPQAQHKPGWPKVEHTCSLARERGIGYAWIDTCCINKSDERELEREINSMFDHYGKSSVCFTYLSDLGGLDSWGVRAPHCRWFKRGWTLQELVASRELVFFDRNWAERGSKHDLAESLSKMTGVDVGLLRYRDGELRGLLDNVPVARRMSWAVGRETTEVEDRAYSLLGLFGITGMKISYGSGDEFLRLQGEIARKTNDMSLFAWQSKTNGVAPAGSRRKRSEASYSGLFAASPDDFAHARGIRRVGGSRNLDRTSRFEIINKGTGNQAVEFPRISLYSLSFSPTSPSGEAFVLKLSGCQIRSGTGNGSPRTIWISVENYGGNMFARAEPHLLHLLTEEQESSLTTTVRAKLCLPLTINSDIERWIKSKKRRIIKFTGDFDTEYYTYEGTFTSPDDEAWDIIHRRVITKDMDLSGRDDFIGMHVFHSDWATEHQCKRFFVVFGRSRAGPWACIVKQSTHPEAFEAAKTGDWGRLRREVRLAMEKKTIRLKRVEHRGENKILAWRKVELVMGLREADGEEIFEVSIGVRQIPCQWL